MSVPEIRFDDGAAYDRMMGVWTQFVGSRFLEWLEPAKGKRWLDVGCGTGAFTQQIIDISMPVAVDGVDPSAAQIDFASKRPGASLARFRTGDAMVLPYDDNAFDVAVMALVIFFVPQPEVSIAEMKRLSARRDSRNLCMGRAWRGNASGTDFPGSALPCH